MPKMVGICDAKEAVWYFDNQVKKCKPFYYTGCGGNENRFLYGGKYKISNLFMLIVFYNIRFASQAECERTCPNAFPPEIEITNKVILLG